MVSVKENFVEDYLVALIEGLGGECLKLEVKGRRGWPDRLCLTQGKMFFVECKRPEGGRLSALQAVRIRRLEELGAPIYVIKNRQQIDELIREISQ